MAIHTAFLFPGQGSQLPGMASDWTDPAARRVFDRARATLGVDIPRLCATASARELSRTEIAQPAIFAVSVAAAWTLAARGVHADVIAGHSLGELAACVAAGALDLDDGFRLVETRARSMARAGRDTSGSMAAVLGLSPATIDELCRGTGAVVANINAPEQVVISGPDHAITRAAAACRAQGARRVIKLDVSVAAHSPLMGPAAEAVRAMATALAWQPPRTLFVSGATGRVEPDPDLPALLADAITAPVRWADAMRSILATGATTFIEVGPGRVLTGLARRLAPGTTTLTAGSQDDVAMIAERIGGKTHATA